MYLQMYCVKDLAVQSYTAPQFFRSRGEALRAFMDACGDGKSNFAKHPGDYEFYYIATYDDETGGIVTPAEPELVMRALDAFPGSNKE